MIITIICAIVLIVGIILYNILDVDDHWLHIVLTAFGATGIFICIIIIITVQIHAEEDYQNKLHEREVIEYRIKHTQDNIVGNEMLYNDIVEFNNSLRSDKKWANNPWTSWFNNAKIASIDYIELPGIGDDSYD